MNIVHVVPAITEEASGPTYCVERLCDALRNLGHKITAVALDWDGNRASSSSLTTFPLGIGPKRLGRSPSMRRWLLRETQQGRVELIHNHSLWMMPNVYAGQAAKQARIPLVVSPHGTLCDWAFKSGSSVKHLFWPTVQRPALQATSCFHATAEAEYCDIRRMGFSQPVCVIPNGIDIRPLASTKDKEHRTLLFLGRIHKKKGVDVLLHAWRAVMYRFPEWRLDIIGPDNNGYLAEMKALAALLGLERVSFCGPLYGENKWEAYSDADLFVLPTHSENFGLSVGESLAAGTPAIVTHGAPWSGLVEHKAGWWIDQGLDSLIASLEEALARTIEDLSEMGLRGRSWIEAEFSWARIGWQMAETYRWLLQGTMKPSWVIEG